MFVLLLDGLFVTYFLKVAVVAAVAIVAAAVAV